MAIACPLTINSTCDSIKSNCKSKRGVKGMLAVFLPTLASRSATPLPEKLSFLTPPPKPRRNFRNSLTFSPPRAPFHNESIGSSPGSPSLLGIAFSGYKSRPTSFLITPPDSTNCYELACENDDGYDSDSSELSIVCAGLDNNPMAPYEENYTDWRDANYSAVWIDSCKLIKRQEKLLDYIYAKHDAYGSRIAAKDAFGVHIYNPKNVSAYEAAMEQTRHIYGKSERIARVWTDIIMKDWETRALKDAEDDIQPQQRRDSI
ncbi:hypothetical protein BZA77DRAFT_343677 [Pyronema omphalodes]|nr:hypothetical protein BZA77DRAFT_343677 [Pyronema omphalodes]